MDNGYGIILLLIFALLTIVIILFDSLSYII